MDNVMQGYDLDAAVRQIGKAIGKAAKAAPDAAEAFARRAIEADMRYMHETGVLDDDGLMGEGEYDEDAAFEIMIEHVSRALPQADPHKLVDLLDLYIEKHDAYMEQKGLLEWD